jgi:tRNA(Ile)-lysidine synthase
MKATEQKVLRFIKDNNLISDGDKILIALSGGPDSVFLLHFLNKFKKKFKIEIGAVHINHLLRGHNSDRDELFCRTICNELKIPFYSFRANVKSFAKKNGYSLEVAGRKIRYKYFEQIAASKIFSKIATAHNADDNAETVFLNIIKGTGVKGIAGIPIQRNKIIRPILCLSKNEILQYLERNKFEYRIDESNLSNDYERNFLRNDIIPLIQKRINPSFTETLLNSSINFQRLNLFLVKILDELKSGVDISPDKFVSLPENLICNTDEFLIHQLIKNLIDENFNVQTGYNDLRKILSLKNKQSGKSEELSNNLLVLKDHDRIVIAKNKSVQKSFEKQIQIGETIQINKKSLTIEEVPKNKIKIEKDTYIEFISADKIKGAFLVRNWKNGDKFYPIGMSGTKKLSDYLNDVKINSLEKKNQLVLLNGNKIVWVIGQRLDDRFKITPTTKKVLRLCLK